MLRKSAILAFIAIAPVLVSDGNSVAAQEIGLLFSDGGLNRGIINATEFVGECPGYIASSLSAYFRDPDVPTKRKRHVRVYNETIGSYDTEDYNDGLTSDRIRIRIGNRHRSGPLTVKSGTNAFSYVIYDGRYGKKSMETLAEGSFEALIEYNLKEEQRDIVWDSAPRMVCADLNKEFISPTYTGDCERYKDHTPRRFLAAAQSGSCGLETVYGGITFIERDYDD